MPDPRQHHHVTAGHLAGFTDKGTRDGKLFVLSLSKSRWRGPLRPEKVATRRDFNRVEIPDEDPYYVEKRLGELLDGPAAPLMHALTASPRVPSDEEFNILLNFVSLQMTRSPRFRERARRALVENMAAAIGEKTKTLEGFKKLVDEMRAAGTLKEEVAYEELQELLKEAPELLKPSRTIQIIQMLLEMNRVFQLNRERYWTLAISDGPDFICSDSPATIIHLRPGIRDELAACAVVMPVSKRIMLVGSPRPAPRALIPADSDYVADMNRTTAHGATELYAPAPVVHGIETPAWSPRSQRP